MMTETTPAPNLELPVRSCRECGNAFRAKRDDQVFCPGGACKRIWWLRAQKRGGVLYPLLVRWRISRGKDRTATLSDICAILDRQIADDKAAGRVLVCTAYTEEQLANPWNPARERRRGRR